MKFTKIITHTVELNDDEIADLVERYDLEENYEDDTPKTEMVIDLLEEIIPWDMLDLMGAGLRCDYNTETKIEGVEE